MGQHLNKNKFMSMLGPYMYEKYNCGSIISAYFAVWKTIHYLKGIYPPDSPWFELKSLCSRNMSGRSGKN